MEKKVFNQQDSSHYFQWRVSTKKVSIYFKNTLLASTTKAIYLKEYGREMYDGIFYIPMSDIERDIFQGSDTKTTCPLKGEASYLNFQDESSVVNDIAWYYDAPLGDADVISNHVAFYPKHVKMIIEPNH